MSKSRCRKHLQSIGKPYPKSACEVCGNVVTGACKYPEASSPHSSQQSISAQISSLQEPDWQYMTRYIRQQTSWTYRELAHVSGVDVHTIVFVFDRESKRLGHIGYIDGLKILAIFREVSNHQDKNVEYWNFGRSGVKK